MPRGRLDENGPIPEKYPNLVEAEGADPANRTKLNVRSSDATLIVSHGPLMGGSELTRKCAVALGKPWKHIDLRRATTDAAIENILDWLSEVKPRVLNVAGPRASEDPQIYDATKAILEGVLVDRNLNMLLALRASVLSQCSQWDQIRWQVPAWFCTVGSVSIGIIAYLHAGPIVEALFFTAVGIFGALCFVLLCKLVTYERQVVSEFNNEAIRRFPTDDHEVRDALEIKRPFEFLGVRLLLTATFWFIVYTGALTIVLLGAAAWLPWHHIAPVVCTILIAVVFEVLVLLVLPRLLQRKPK